MEQIKLNIIPDGIEPVVHCKQYDTGRPFRIYLYNGKKPYFLTDEVIEIDVRKRDTKIVTADLEVVPGNRYVDVETTEQMCAVTGRNEAEIKITKGDVVIATLSFFIDVKKSTMQGGLQSESEINNLNRQVQDAVAADLAEHGA